MRVRDAFLTADAEDQTSFENVPFATMTLLSNRRFTYESDSQSKEGHGIKEQGIGQGRLIHGQVCRISLPSKYRRDALSVEVIRPNTLHRQESLINKGFMEREMIKRRF